MVHEQLRRKPHLKFQGTKHNKNAKRTLANRPTGWQDVFQPPLPFLPFEPKILQQPMAVSGRELAPFSNKIKKHIPKRTSYGQKILHQCYLWHALFWMFFRFFKIDARVFVVHPALARILATCFLAAGEPPAEIAFLNKDSTVVRARNHTKSSPTTWCFKELCKLKIV